MSCAGCGGAAGAGVLATGATGGTMQSLVAGPASPRLAAQAAAFPEDGAPLVELEQRDVPWWPWVLVVALVFSLGG